MSEPTETVEETPKPAKVIVKATRPARPSIIRPTPVHAVEDLEDEPGFLKRNFPAIIVGFCVAAGGIWYAVTPHEQSAPVRKAPEQKIVMVQLPPPPPPPPPPKIKPPEPPKDEKRPEQPQEAKPEPKPEAPKPAEKPPEGLGTNVKGNGPGMAGLGSSGNGVIGGTGTGPGGGNGAGREYATRLSTKLTEVLRANPKMRTASARVNVRVWVDARGRVTRAALVSSTGDAALDTALTDQIIPGTTLPDGPPRGLGMPITLRINATRQR